MSQFIYTRHASHAPWMGRCAKPRISLHKILTVEEFQSRFRKVLYLFFVCLVAAKGSAGELIQPDGLLEPVMHVLHKGFEFSHF